jgi:23S rRNA (adenine2503-C2)-methyltransferase
LRSQIGLEEMGAALRENAIKMRAQLWNWIYVRGVSDFDHMPISPRTCAKR